MKPPSEKRAEQLAALVADLYVVDAYYLQQNRIVLSLRNRYDRIKSAKLLKDRLELAGYRFTLSQSEGVLLLSVDPEKRLVIPRLNIILFLATLGTVFFLPRMIFGWDGYVFTTALMSILLVHEMGHFVASRRRGIITSWPYFIPAPNIIGTFGAVIRSKSPFRNRRDLIEVGAAGPIVGWFVALGWLVYGLSQSTVLTGDPTAFAGMAFYMDGESILIKTLVPILIGPAPADALYLFSEAAFAGWVGLLVTALNMLPIGQLDGGHVVYGLARKRQTLLGWLACGGLFILGFQSMMWWVFGAMALIMRVPHPPTLDDRIAPSTFSRIMGWTALVILILSFTPVPFR
jgi:membrane-associated protease RseP (regulator of RpoE activity)